MNGSGPFFLHENARTDPTSRWRQRHPEESDFHRRYRVRLPPGLIQQENRIELSFYPWRESTGRPYDWVLLQAMGLTRGSTPPR